MRSQSLLRKSHLLLKHSTTVQSSQRSLLFKRTHQATNGLPSIRSLSSSAIPPPEPEEIFASSTRPEALPDEAKDATEQNAIPEEPERPSAKPRRTRMNASSSSSIDEPLEFPPGLEENILYYPAESILTSQSNSGFPPPEIFEEALDNLLITLHPQNQHRAMHATGGSSRPVEPTLGLYCPIEGGDYVIDLTVQELAFQTRSEVLVLDSVQLAAGEWGPFGKAAASFNLPNNPLHFPSLSPQHVQQSGRPMNPTDEQEDHEEASPVLFATPSRMSLAISRPFPPIQNRALVTPNSRKAVPPSKLDTFFEALVNLPFPIGESQESSAAGGNRPRLIYIRDFPTLAPSSSLWYPPLLTAVRQRRRRLLSRASNTTSSPVTIIFGMTPPVAPVWNSSPAGSSNSSLMNLLMDRSSANSPIAFGTKPEQVHDWSESEAAEAAREKRLRSRLKKWEKSSAALLDEFPRLTSPQEADSPGPILLIGGGEAQMTLPSLLGVPLGLDSGSDSVNTTSKLFRSSILVPKNRSLSQERETRVARRREINELTVRMGVGAVGGIVDPEPASSALQSVDMPVNQTSDASPTARPSSVWEDWGNRIEAWSTVRKIADRAMGSIMILQQTLSNQEKATLAPTVVPWSAVQTAWKSYHSLSDTRKNWLKESVGAMPSDDALEGKQGLSNAGSESDKVLENVRNDPDLDQHEVRLLPCIVDSGSITTTFSQVHLPSHTIDSIRTIVSLPLLHPHAFQQGILKQHSMTGCLLFGPPGTGKTLAVRALAKEAGCRMLAISPSDVMDMYVGEGEKLVRAVFSLARRLSPCVVFLDEIDALFGARMSARDSGGAFAHRGVITEFMQEMDGLKSSKEDNVIVIGATNRPFDLDDAVLRRLPRRLLVDLPGEKERKEILKILLRDEILTEDANVEALAKKTDGFSGSDLKHLCVSAALDSVKEHLDVPWLSRHSTTDPALPVASSPSFAPETFASPNNQVQAAVQGQKSAEIEEVALNSHPNIVLSADQSLTASKSSESSAPERVLRLRNFTQALKEITPSSSESLGSLAELRKWNDEFGEGRKNRKKYQVWGKGRFGFVDKPKDTLDENRVPRD